MRLAFVFRPVNDFVSLHTRWTMLFQTLHFPIPQSGCLLSLATAAFQMYTLKQMLSRILPKSVF